MGELFMSTTKCDHQTGVDGWPGRGHKLDSRVGRLVHYTCVFILKFICSFFVVHFVFVVSINTCNCFCLISLENIFAYMAKNLTDKNIQKKKNNKQKILKTRAIAPTICRGKHNLSVCRMFFFSVLSSFSTIIIH